MWSMLSQHALLQLGLGRYCWVWICYCWVLCSSTQVRVCLQVWKYCLVLFVFCHTACFRLWAQLPERCVWNNCWWVLAVLNLAFLSGRVEYCLLHPYSRTHSAVSWLYSGAGRSLYWLRRNLRYRIHKHTLLKSIDIGICICTVCTYMYVAIIGLYLWTVSL